jgi:hypothetical protein
LSYVPFAVVALIAVLGVTLSVGTETGRAAMAVYGQALIDQGAPATGTVQADQVAVRQ